MTEDQIETLEIELDAYKLKVVKLKDEIAWYQKELKRFRRGWRVLMYPFNRTCMKVLAILDALKNG